MNTLSLLIYLVSCVPSIQIDDYSTQKFYQYNLSPRIVSLELTNKPTLTVTTQGYEVESNIGKLPLASLEKPWITETKITIEWTIEWDIESNTIECDVISELYDWGIEHIGEDADD